MTGKQWNPDDATVPPLDEADPVAPWRYGVTAWEASHHEPLDVALAQELPEPAGEVDERWTEVDDDDPFSGRLVADETVGDDDYALAVDEDVDGFAAEELAMHVVEP